MLHIIRQIEEKDNIALAKMVRAVFVEHDAPRQGTVYSDPTTDDLYKLFQVPKAVLWMAEENGQLLGCCGVYPTEGLPEACVELVKFYLPKEARGKGIGKALMEKCFVSAKEFGYTHMYLESLPDFAKAVSMYEKSGFKQLSKPMGNSGHTSCNIWMLKRIDGK